MIDTSKIEGYADMTTEQKLAALEGYEIPEPDYTGYVKKDVFDKTASELSKVKKSYNALLTEDERNKAANDEAVETMKQELEALKREKVVSEHTANFLALGYDKELAADTANALAEGDMAKVFANQKQFLANHDKTLKAEAMKNTPTPPAGGGGGANYQKLIDEAMSRGDMATVAAYMRQQQENK